jgi:hypothetical protein
MRTATPAGIHGKPSLPVDRPPLAAGAITGAVVVVDDSIEVDVSVELDDAVEVGAAVVGVWARAAGPATTAVMTPSATTEEATAHRTGETVPERAPG